MAAKGHRGWNISAASLALFAVPTCTVNTQGPDLKMHTSAIRGLLGGGAVMVRRKRPFTVAETVLRVRKQPRCMAYIPDGGGADVYCEAVSVAYSLANMLFAMCATLDGF